jgi:hypothetical protein
VAGDVQTYATSSTLGCDTGIFTDNATTHTVSNANYQASGPNPWNDITAYGARATTGQISTTATTTSSSTAVTVAASGSFVVGDGIVIYGAGANNALATPSTPTVTPSLAGAGMGVGNTVASVAGASSESCAVIASDGKGGLTAPSTFATISTAQSTLGLTTASITSMARSGGTVTVTMASATPLAVGAMVHVYDSSDATFSGFFPVASVTNSTTWTYVQGISTLAGTGVTTSATGGTAGFYVNNYITWTNPTGTWQMGVYCGSGSTLAFRGLSEIGATYFEDYGQTAPAAPAYWPAMITVGSFAGMNDYLSTTITAIGSSTAITVANAATNAVTGATMLQDSAPGFYAAANASIPGIVHIPAYNNASAETYYINSKLVLPNNHPTIFQSGALTVNETIQFPIHTTWKYFGTQNGNCPQFCWNEAQQIIVNTLPGLYSTQSDGSLFEGVNFTSGNNTHLMTTAVNGPYNFTVRDSTFVTAGTSGGDIVGIGLSMNNPSNLVLDTVLFSSSRPSTDGSTITPVLNDNNPGQFYARNLFLVGGGVMLNSPGGAGIGSMDGFFNGVYGQQVRSPMVMLGGIENQSIHIDTAQNDTSTTAYIANWSTASASVDLRNITAVSAEPEGTPGTVTGRVFSQITAISTGFGLGQNYNASITNGYQVRLPVYCPTSNVPFCSSGAYWGLQTMQMPIHFPSKHTLFWDLPVPTGVTVTATSGGSIAAGNYTVNVTAIGFDGGETSGSTGATCTTTSGTQTCSVSWTAVVGAQYYKVYAGGQAQPGSCFLTASTSCSFSSIGNNGNGPPKATGTGLVSGMSDHWISPVLVMPNQSVCPGGECVTGEATLWSNSSGRAMVSNNGATSYYVASTTGSTVTNDCAKFDANGNVIDALAPCGSGGGGGSVTNFTSGGLSPLFTTSVATATTTPVQSFTLSTAAAGTLYGNNTGGAAAPAFGTANSFNIPTFTGTLTSGVIPQAGASGTILNSSPQLDNGVTTVATLTYAGTGGISSAGGFTSTMSGTGLLSPSPGTLSSLGAASSHTGGIAVISDSTTISTEGQTCAGGGTGYALAFSTGSVWKCF